MMVLMSGSRFLARRFNGKRFSYSSYVFLWCRQTLKILWVLFQTSSIK